MVFKIVFWTLITPLLAFGFQIIPKGNFWNINASTTAASKLFVVYSNPTQVVTNDLPAGDVLAGTSTVTVQQIMTSIFNDYNSIAGAFVILADSSDPDFALNSTNRTITIELSNNLAGATSGGQAQQSWTGSNISACRILVKPSVYDKAKFLTSLLTHELGHCLGLAHPMDTTNSIMSYYVSPDLVRLQVDDKMGLVYLYPTDTARAREEPTLGFSCARK